MNVFRMIYLCLRFGAARRSEHPATERITQHPFDNISSVFNVQLFDQKEDRAVICAWVACAGNLSIVARPSSAATRRGGLTPRKPTWYPGREARPRWPDP